MTVEEKAVELRRQYKREWYAKNKEKVREYHRMWREKHPEYLERYREYNKRYWEKKALAVMQQEQKNKA